MDTFPPHVDVILSQDLRVGKAYWTSDSILILKFEDDILIEVEDVIALSDVTHHFCKGKPYLSIVVPGLRNDITREARTFDFSKALNRPHVAIAEAVVVENIATRIAADFYYKFRRFPYPTKTFSSYEKALNWIREVQKLNQKP